MKPAGRTAGWVGPLVLAAGLIVAGLGALFAYKWITEDEQDVYGPCSHGTGTCLQGGETLNMTFGIVFGTLGVASVLAGIWLIGRRRTRVARDRELIERGLQRDAVITGAAPTGMTLRSGGRVTKQGYKLELDPGDDGTLLVIKAWLPPGIVPGARVRIAYDPASRDAVLLEIPGASPAGDLFAHG